MLSYIIRLAEDRHSFCVLILSIPYKGSAEVLQYH